MAYFFYGSCIMQLDNVIIELSCMKNINISEGGIMYKTIEQIHKEYDGKWVFLINCVEGEYHSIAGGEVALSSERRDKVLREMDQYRHEKSDTLIFYAGKLPEGVSVLL